MLKINKFLFLLFLYLQSVLLANNVLHSSKINKHGRIANLMSHQTELLFQEAIQTRSVDFPPNVTVAAVDIDDNATIEIWTEIVLASFSHAPTEQDLLDWLTSIKSYISNSNLKLYFGYYDNEPVAAAIVIEDTLISTLHWVGVKPEYRNRGIGAAVVRQILYDAQLAGLKVVTLLSTVQLKNLH